MTLSCCCLNLETLDIQRRMEEEKTNYKKTTKNILKENPGRQPTTNSEIGRNQNKDLNLEDIE